MQIEGAWTSVYESLCFLKSRKAPGTGEREQKLALFG